MAVKIKKGDALSLLNLTPIIDVVFNLLIFWMVATKFEEEERSLDVSLPQANYAAPLISKPQEFFVNINDRGEYFIGGSFVSRGELEASLRQTAADNPGRQAVVIRADKHCVWQHVVTVMDLCNKVSIRDYRVTTAAPDAE